MSHRKVIYCFLLLTATLVFAKKLVGQNNLFLDDYAFACVDAGKSLIPAIDSGCYSFVLGLYQEGDSFYLKNTSDKNLFHQKLDSIAKLTDKAIVVLKGNYKQSDLKEYLTTLEKDIFIGDWEQWPLLTTFLKEKHHITVFLEDQLTLALTDSLKRNSSNLEQILNESLNKLVIFEPSTLEIDSLTSTCYNQWNATGKIPNFVVVSPQYVRQAKNTINTINQTRRFKGEVKFQDSFLNKIYWKQFPGSVTSGKFSFPLLDESIILSPYKNGFKITPGEIIHNIGMKDVPRLLNAFESTMQDKLFYHFRFEHNTDNQVEKDWKNTISKGANWIKDDERKNVVHFKQLNSFIDYSKDNSLNFNTPISVSVWVKPDSLMNFMGIVGFGKAFSLKLRKEKLSFTTATIKDHLTDSLFKIDNWTQVGIVFTPGATVDFYSNGKKVKSVVASKVLPSNQALIIGNNVWGEQFYGAVDELMIWDRGLSEKEFSELYQNQLTPQSISFQNKLIMFVGVACLFLLLILLFKTKRTKEQKLQLNSSKAKKNQYTVHTFANRIEIFGTFNVVSEKEGNISKLFSPLLKQLLSFFIINTVYSENGITSKKINDTFWPGFTKIQAKENRGTNIQKLRKLLEHLPGVNIVFREKRWFFECSRESYTDLLQYANLRNLLSNQLNSSSVNFNDVKKFLSVLKNGKILQNIDSEWLDETKNKISYEVNTLLSRLCSEEIKGNTLKVDMAKTMLHFDDLNEEALKIMVKELIKNGNHGQAKQAFEEFGRRYFILYSEHFPVDYNSLQKSK
uniref:LamG domain-containing protein n=1 Tax=uncultured Draconibacterium sp. TaxID=1573823 RepID=UPI0032165F8E